MNDGRVRTSLLRVALLFILLACSNGTGSAQVPVDRPQFDPLRALKHALEEAAAPQLSSEQETALLALVKSFHETNPRPGPDDALRAAHSALDQAILAGDAAAAQAQAGAIVNILGTNQLARLRAEASFQIAVLGIIKANAAQYNALVARFGAAGLAGLLKSPLGGPGGPGRPGRGGPDGPGPGPGRRPPGQ